MNTNHDVQSDNLIPCGICIDWTRLLLHYETPINNLISFFESQPLHWYKAPSTLKISFASSSQMLHTKLKLTERHAMPTETHRIRPPTLSRTENPSNKLGHYYVRPQSRICDNVVLIEKYSSSWWWCPKTRSKQHKPYKTLNKPVRTLHDQLATNIEKHPGTVHTPKRKNPITFLPHRKNYLRNFDIESYKTLWTLILFVFTQWSTGVHNG